LFEVESIGCGRQGWPRVGKLAVDACSDSGRREIRTRSGTLPHITLGLSKINMLLQRTE
jgi:hypothetical protein